MLERPSDGEKRLLVTAESVLGLEPAPNHPEGQEHEFGRDRPRALAASCGFIDPGLEVTMVRHPLQLFIALDIGASTGKTGGQMTIFPQDDPGAAAQAALRFHLR